MKRGQRSQKRIPNRREAERQQARYREAAFKVQMFAAATASATALPEVEEKPVYKRPVLAGLTRRQSKILRRLAEGWVVGLGRGLRLIKGKVVGAKIRLSDVLHLVEQGLLTAQNTLTASARALLWAIRTNAKQVMLVEHNANALDAKAALHKAAAQY